MGDTIVPRGDGRRGGPDEVRPAHDAVSRERARELEELARQRFRVGALLTLAMVVIYFAFILLIAYDKEFVGKIITDGLSLGMLLGVIVILSVWALTLFYVRWANQVYEPRVKRMKR